MKRRMTAAIAALAMTLGQGWAAPACQGPADFAALRTAALQQEMMVAALACHEIDAYNDFVLSHRAALLKSDKVLLKFFMAANRRTGDGDYNLYKTELANSASIRAIRDGRFCERVHADFLAAHGRSLDEGLSVLPYPVDTGTVRCPLFEAAAPAARPGPSRTADSADKVVRQP